MRDRNFIRSFFVGTLMRAVAFALLAVVVLTVSRVSEGGLSSAIAYTLIALVAATMVAIFLAATIDPARPSTERSQTLGADTLADPARS